MNDAAPNADLLALAFNNIPTPCAVVTVAGRVLHLNRMGAERLSLDTATPISSIYDALEPGEKRFEGDLERAAGTSGWHRSVAVIRQGDFEGMHQSVRMRGMRLKGGENPVVLLCFSDEMSNHFREHTALIARLNRELSRQRELQEKLEAAVDREQYLHRELIHRIKNNLAVLSSIIRTQYYSVTSDEAREALQQIELRTSSIALVHDLLDRSNNVEAVETHDLIKELCDLMNRSLLPEHITLTCEVDSLILHNEDATTLCLLINELLTNALKHAFSPGMQGRIELVFRQNGVDKMELRVRDDGAGSNMPTIGPDELTNGTSIVFALAEQLNGELTHKGDDGTEWTLIFDPREADRHAAE